MKKRMSKFMTNTKAKFVAVGLSATMIAGMAAPMTANAMSADSSIKTVGAHKAAETAGNILGAEQATALNSMSANHKEIFGSDANVSPSVYLYNYINNEGLETERTKILSSTVGPHVADTIVSGDSLVSDTLSMRPDILLGTGANNASAYPTYDDLLEAAKEAWEIEEEYNPTQIAYTVNNMNDLLNTMYDLADAIGTNGRYGDAELIAKDYERYVKATKYYVTKKLAEKNLEQKEVAIILAGPTTDSYYAYGVNSASGTAGSCRGAEYLAGTTLNIIDDASVAKTVSGDKYVVTQSALVNSDVDYIFLVGAQGAAANEDNLQSALTAAGSDAEIVNTLPEVTFGIVMNSAENALGVGLFQSIVYGDLNEGNDYDILDMNDAVAYFFQNFYHVKNASIDDIANDYYTSDGHNMVPLGYKVMTSDTMAIQCASDYDAILSEGITYYNAHTSDFTSIGLGLTSNYTSIN